VGLVADAVINFNPGTAAEPLAPDAVIVGTVDKGFMEIGDELSAKAKEVMTNLNEVANKRLGEDISRTLLAVQRMADLYANPRVGPSAELQRTLVEVQRMGARLDSTLNEFQVRGTLAQADTLMSSLAKLSNDARASALRLIRCCAGQPGRGDPGQVRERHGVYANAQRALKSIQELVDDIRNIREDRADLPGLLAARVAPDRPGAGDELIGRRRAPAACRIIGKVGGALPFPLRDDRVDHPPRRLRRVIAQKQHRVARHAVEQQRLVGVVLRRAERFVVGKVHPSRADPDSRPGELDLEAQGQPFIGLHPEDQHVRRESLAGFQREDDGGEWNRTAISVPAGPAVCLSAERTALSSASCRSDSGLRHTSGLLEPSATPSPCDSRNPFAAERAAHTVRVPLPRDRVLTCCFHPTVSERNVAGGSIA
jgi:hypothetical protein